MQNETQANAAATTEAAKPQPGTAESAAALATQATEAAAAKRATAEANAAKRAKRNAASKPSAKPATAKRNGKPATTAAKPKRAASAADQAKRDAARAANNAHHDKLRAQAARFYNGASLAAHKAKPAKLADYVARVRNPVQKPANGAPSTRDESGLALILAHADKRGHFDPCAISIDLGILSRVASLGYVATDGKTFTLTKAGRERAAVVAKRAA